MADPNNYSQFFAKLKAVCRNVEQGISQLQNDVDKKSSSRSSGKAVMKLRNLKQEIQDMKVINQVFGKIEMLIIANKILFHQSCSKNKTNLGASVAEFLKSLLELTCTNH